MDQMKNFGPLQAIAKFLSGLTGPQRFVAAAFISTSLVLLIVVSVIATRPKMSVLFSGLQPSDAGQVVAKLQEKKIPYEVEGNNIKIPERYVAATRMELASAGLPQSGTVGFEIFDKGGLGIQTEFQQRLNYQRAIQGELSRSINELQGVEASRVHVTIPEQKLFTKNNKPSTSSVILKLRPGSSLSADQVGGIVHLVSAAVEGLSPDNVTIVDTNGRMLTQPSDGSGLDMQVSSTQLRMKREHEQQVEKDVQTMLEGILGPGKAVVRVNAQIDFDRRETSSESYKPLSDNKGVLLSEISMEETYGSGLGSNSDKSDYKRVETTNKYEVSRITEHIIKAPGQITKMSIAVMVDGELEAEKIGSIKNAVMAAAGIDTARGDLVTVESMAFDTSAAEEDAKELAAIAKTESYMSIGKTVGAVLLLFGFIFMLKGALKKINVTFAPEPAVRETVVGQAAPMQAHIPTPAAAGAGNGSQTAGGEQIEPTEVAQVVRKWMSDNQQTN